MTKLTKVVSLQLAHTDCKELISNRKYSKQEAQLWVHRDFSLSMWPATCVTAEAAKAL